MKFYDLTFNRHGDGSIRLIQSDHGEDYIIDAHPEQLLFVARQLCGMKPETAEKVADLERRIAVLTDKLQDFACNKYMRSEILERCGDGVEWLARLDALLDLALEFDGGRLEPEEHAPDDCEVSPQHEHVGKSSDTQPGAIVPVPEVNFKQYGLAV